MKSSDRFSLFRWPGDLIWVAMVILPLAAFVSVLIAGAPEPGPVIVGVTAAAFWSITLIRYWDRWRWLRSMAFVTPQGVRVWLHGSTRDRLMRWWASASNPMRPCAAFVSDALEDAIALWPVGLRATIRDYIDGAVLDVWPDPLPVRGQTWKAAGLTNGRDVTIAWKPSESFGRLWALLEHEYGAHVARNALGLPTREEVGPVPGELG
jgi:hypothetical protein